MILIKKRVFCHIQNIIETLHIEAGNSGTCSFWMPRARKSFSGDIGERGPRTRSATWYMIWTIEVQQVYRKGSQHVN